MHKCHWCSLCDAFCAAVNAPCMLQLKKLLEEHFSTLDSFKQDIRYRVPHDDHAHAAKVSLCCLTATAVLLRRPC